MAKSLEQAIIDNPELEVGLLEEFYWSESVTEDEKAQHTIDLLGD